MWEPSPVNMTKGSNTIFPKLKSGTVENGSPKLAGYSCSLVWETVTGNKEEGKEDEWVFNELFVLIRKPYTETMFII